jgi:hypothetical protein
MNAGVRIESSGLFTLQIERNDRFEGLVVESERNLSSKIPIEVTLQNPNGPQEDAEVRVKGHNEDGVAVAVVIERNLRRERRTARHSVVDPFGCETNGGDLMGGHG